MPRFPPSRLALAVSAILLGAPDAHAACVTLGSVTTCDATAPDPWTSTVGTGSNAGEDNRRVELQPGSRLQTGNANAISLRDSAVILIGGGSTVSATASSTAGLSAAGGNTIELRSNGVVDIAAGGQILATGTQASAEPLNLLGSGNVVSNSGLIQARTAAAIWLDNSTGGNTLVNTATGVIQAPGTAVGGTGNGALRFTNEGRVIGNVLFAGGDDVLDLGGRIEGAVRQGGGNDIVLLRAGSVITGTLAQDAGDDRLDVQGGSVGGAVTQCLGDDTAVLAAGTLASLDQGEGADSLTVSGGSVTGTVQQGSGMDTFLMTGGTLGALLQGDNYDYFRMTGGRIVGAFDDGDYAEMTGGRIGRVNMKLDNNVFDMSGGTIDGNLVAGFGNDRIVLSDGYIGGNISVSGGNDSVDISGGTVRGEVRMSFGNDRFGWDGGGVVHGLIDLGDGDDSARLANLNQANLGAMPGLDGGVGNDSLVMENVKTTGVARYTGWEKIDLETDTQLTFDDTLRLGDAVSGTGTLTLDPTSALFASGTAGGIAGFGGGLAEVFNAGRIDLSSNGSAGDRFTVRGNYTGNGGALYLDTVLGDDSAASDRLVVSGGRIAGTTGLGIRNAGGAGAATLVDGILVVQATDGATSDLDAFALYTPIAAGAYEYYLFKGGVSAGSGENWYLRSTVVTALPPPVTPPPVAPPPPPAPGLPPPPPPPPPPVTPVVPPTPAPAPPPAPVPPEAPVPPAPPEDLGDPPVDLPPAPPPPPDVVLDPEAPDPDPVAPEPAPPPPPPEPEPVPEPTLTEPPPVPDTPAVLPTAPGLLAPPTPEARAPRAAVVPIYRLETPAYAVVPSLLQTVSQASLGTFHERQGEQRLLAGEGGLRAAWARLIGSSEEQHWQGDALTGFDGDLQGVQAGLDVYADTTAAGWRNQVGVFAGRTRATGRITGLALGWENVDVGQLRLDDTHAGLSWTGVGSAGGYIDVVLMQSRYRGRAWSTRGLGIEVRGDGTTASVEVGKPMLRFGQSSWWLEPQLQVIWQRQSLDETADAIAAIRFDADNAWTGRAGVRIAGDYGLADTGWQPYIKLNYWKTFDGENRTDFDSNRIVSLQQTRGWEVGVGVTGRLNRNVSAFGVVDYTADLENRDRDRRSTQATVGLRLDW